MTLQEWKSKNYEEPSGSSSKTQEWRNKNYTNSAPEAKPVDTSAPTVFTPSISAPKPAVVESPYQKGVYAHPLNGSRVTKQQLQDDLNFNEKQRQQLAEQSAMLTGDAYYAAKEQIDKKAQEAARLQSALASITRQERTESAAKQQQEYNSRKESPNAKHFVEAGKNSKDNEVEASRANWQQIAYNEAQGIQSGGRSIYRHMTDEEVNTYNYILGKDGKQAAKDYLLNIEEALAQREGEAQAKHLEGMGGISKGIYGMAAGSSNALEGMRQNRFEDALPTGAMQFGSQKLRENMSGLGGVAYDLSYQVGNMLPSMVASAAFGGSGLLAKGAASAYTGFSAKGNAYNQAIKDGYSKEQARSYSTMIGAAEGVLQYLLSGIGKLGGVTDDILIAKTKGIDNALARLALTGLIKIGGEVAEEELQLIIEPTLRSLILNEEFNAPTWNDVAYTALLSALTVGAMEGAPKGLAKLGGKGLDIYNKTVDSIKNKRGANPLAPAQGNAPQATTDSTATNEPQSAEFEPQSAPQETVQNAPQTTPVEPKTQAQPVTQPTAETNKGITPEAKAQMEVQGEIDYRENSQKFDTTEEYAADLESRKQMAQEEFDYAEGDSVSQRLAELAEVLAEEKAYQKHNNTVGAASAEFFENQKTDFDRLVDEAEEFYPVGANPAPGRYVATPTKDFEGRKISRFPNNALGAAALSEETVSTIERLTAEGVLSYDTLTNTQNLADAETEINSLGIDGAMEKLRGAASRQETSPRLVAMMEVLLVDASARNDQEMAAELIDIGARLSESSARAMQMFSYLRKFAPEYQLKGIERQIEQMNEDIKARKPKSKKKVAQEAEQKKATQKEAQETHEAVKEGRKSAATEIGKKLSSANYSRKGGKNKSAPQTQSNETLDWAQKLGEELATKLTYRKEKQRTAFEQVASQLNRFVKEKLPPSKKQKALTPTELLREYIQNAEFYNRAWENAQVELRNRGVEDPVLDEFMNTGINMDVDGNAKTTIFVQALVHAASQSGETRAMIEKQSALGVTNIAENISNKLIAETGATGEFAFTIREAAESYVNDVLRDGELDQEKFVNSAVNSAMRDIGQTFSALATKRENVKQSVKQQIVDVLSKKYGIGVADAEGIADIANETFDRISREKTRQVLESRFKDRKPSVKKSVEQLFEEYANLGAFDADSPFNEQATVKVFGLDKEAGYTITIPQELKNEFLAAKDDAARGEVIKKMQKSIAEQTPSTVMDLFTAWRYTNMLGTLRGPAKNTIGNAAMRLLGEVNNAIVTGVEKLAMGKVGRTRSLYVGSAYMDAGKADFDAHKSQILGDAKYSETGSNLTDFQRGVQDQRRIMQMPGTWGKGENASAFSKNVRKTVDVALFLEEGRRKSANWMLNNKFFGDTAFARNAYARFLGGYLKANGITAKQFADEAWRKSHPQVVENARNFAAKEAQELTFRDNNKIAEWAAKVGRRKDTPWFARMVSEGVAPFRKTLVNIAIRGEQYSPLGYVNAMVEGIQKARGKDVTGNDIVNSLSKATSGTMLLLLGMFMRRNGLLRAKEDDEEQAAFDDLVGKQDYSITIPDVGNFTVDWMAPTSMPLFMGAALADVFDGSGLTLDDMTDVFFAIADPLIELSMMQGIQDTLDEVQYSDNRLLQLGVNAALGYLTQGLTSTLLGQLERTTQENRQSTYVDKNSGIPDWLQRKAGAASAKIPGWDYHQIDYVDAWGRVEKNIENPFLRGAYELMSPAYIDKEEMDALETELQRLYDASGKSPFPERAEKTISFTIGEEGNTRQIKIDLSADQYVKYAKSKGQKSHQYAKAATKTSAYKKMNSTDKVDFINKMYEVANFEAAKTIDARFGKNDDEMQGYANAKDYGIAPQDYYIFQQGANDAHGDDRQDQIVAIINGMKLTGKQKEYLITTKYKTRGHEIAKEQGWI